MAMTTLSRAAAMRASAIRRLIRHGGKAKITKMLDRVRPEDVAIALRSLTPDERFIVFEILNTDFPQAVTEVLTEL
jgi:Mg/Co/Ni transporter MgtE